VSRAGQLTRKIERPEQISFIARWMQETVERALTAGPVLLTLGRESKSREQEAKYHAMIEDIRYQCFRGYSREAFKAALVNQFALEMKRNGEPLGNPGEQAWDWVNQVQVYVRPSTKGFRKKEAADFIEFLYATGSEYSVNWSDKSLAIYDEMQEARAA
jgi:hypothetical protein